MEFKRGQYVILESTGQYRHIYGHVMAANLLRNSVGSVIVGYARMGMAGGIFPVCYFADDQKNQIVFPNIEDAEEYVYLRGWDDDNTPTLCNYSTIPGRMIVAMAKNIMNPNGYPPLSLFSALDHIDVTITIEKPKCDCGGEKCKLPHMTWCSVYKEPE